MVLKRKQKRVVIEAVNDSTYFFCDWCHFGYTTLNLDARRYVLDDRTRSMLFTCPECGLESQFSFSSDELSKLKGR